ncbi:MAG TPA: helix-turn-helix domain-containing protein [Thermoleophilia bacterium]|nr:helix-turn-helix domain-containing protein [Thermoleophilia bacterium]
MADEDAQHPRRGRDATTAAILDAADVLFRERGYEDVTVRDIAEQAGVSHALVHQYVGSKEDLFRAVLSRNDGYMTQAAPADIGLLESARLILRSRLEPQARDYGRLLMRTALSGVPYDQTTGRFAAVEQLIELAERQAASASASERAEKDLAPRLVGACIGSLYLGWVSGESWLRPAWGLEDMEDDEVASGLERVILSILKDHVPGVASEAASAADVRELKIELAEMHAEITALRELLKARQQSAEESA